MRSKGRNIKHAAANVGRRIEEIRVSKKLSRQDLASLLGITYLQVYRLENGITRISVDVAAQLASALKVSVSALYKASAA